MKYLKMLIPRYGKFSNGYYDVVGLMWLGRLKGVCTYSINDSVMRAGDWKNLPEYHLRKDTKPQFKKVKK